MKGIMFKEELFNKILAGRKTQTRRIIKSPTGYFAVHMDKHRHIIDIVQADADEFELDPVKPIRPKYKVDDIIYLKEPYFILEPEHVLGGMANRFVYKYGVDADIEKFRKDEYEYGYVTYYWHNKMFMPAKYARYFIRITGIKVQRLQDITEEDARAEGVTLMMNMDKGYIYQDYVSAFCDLWKAINGKDSWDANPWVWVYEFELTEKPEE